MRLQSLREGCLLALDQIAAHRFRSLLTILGIVVGVATVMIMSAAVTGVRSSIVEQIQAAGPKNFIVSRFDFNAVTTSDETRSWRDNPRITAMEARRIAELDVVQTALADMSFSAVMDNGDAHASNVQVAGDGVGWSAFTAGSFIAGRDFLASDVRASRPVVVLSKPLAEQLFGQLDPIGRRIRIDGVAFRVTGVYDVAGSIFSQLVEYFAVVPYTAAFKHLDVWGGFLQVLVAPAEGVTQAEAMDRVIAELRTLRGLRPGERNNFALIRQEELLDSFNRITGIFFLVLIALSSIALLVGGVGVVAIMMISVTERTREIGLRKALGATRHEILWQFLFESATLTVIGAAIGMVFGGGLAFLVNAHTPIPAAVPVWAIVAALVTAAVAGILFGLWPAWRAARMDPVVALRYE